MRTDKLTPKELRGIMTKTMFDLYQKDGTLDPMLFSLKDGIPDVSPVPEEFFSSVEKKKQLAHILKQMGKVKSVECIGLIFEAYGRKVTPDSELLKLIQSGNIKISELNEKLELICMFIATRQGEEMLSWEVDPKTKTVIGRFGPPGQDQPTGIFSGIMERE